MTKLNNGREHNNTVLFIYRTKIYMCVWVRACERVKSASPITHPKTSISRHLIRTKAKEQTMRIVWIGEGGLTNRDKQKEVLLFLFLFSLCVCVVVGCCFVLCNFRIFCLLKIQRVDLNPNKLASFFFFQFE